jgi:putative transposase
MTLTERWDRLFVSVNYAVRTSPTKGVSKPGVRAGVDLGLASLATVADTEGNITELPNPAPLRQAMAERRRAGRQMSRRIPGSRGFAAAKTKLARMDRGAVHLRREAHHQLTTWLAGTYSEIVVEDLDLAAMNKSMGRRAFRRSVSDAALGLFRPLLSYKTARAGTTLIVADRFFPSSQLHHGCGRRLEAPAKLAKLLVCPETGELVDRDQNAALNLRDWPDRAVTSTASLGLVEAQAPNVSSPAGSGGDVGSDEGSTPRRRRNRKPVARKSEASSSEARTRADLYRSAKEPRKRGAE